jgi:hypothetical protein
MGQIARREAREAARKWPVTTRVSGEITLRANRIGGDFRPVQKVEDCG